MPGPDPRSGGPEQVENVLNRRIGILVRRVFPSDNVLVAHDVITSRTGFTFREPPTGGPPGCRTPHIAATGQLLRRKRFRRSNHGVRPVLSMDGHIEHTEYRQAPLPASYTDKRARPSPRLWVGLVRYFSRSHNLEHDGLRRVAQNPRSIWAERCDFDENPDMVLVDPVVWRVLQNENFATSDADVPYESLWPDAMGALSQH